MKNLLIFILFIILILISSNCSKQSTESKVYVAIYNMHKINDNNSFVIVSADSIDKYIQFYSYDGVVYYDFPLFNEIKNEYFKHAQLGSKSKKLDDSWLIPFANSSQISNFETLLDSLKIERHTIRQGFIEPTIFNQTDTTGWSTSIRGPINVESELIDNFIDGFFKEVHDLPKGSFKLIITEQKFNP